ncbi:hypothetical protein THRCLA_09775 [Thraustotheca clavata]|uniref:Uncharacterized protein n=1 Tax=Thraustotheca clavata TaxID=74557 RepID=A0A1V9YUF7_9STRA|nr:hypothetical protein THRCLA_09775 [Thraustotheca clavata]
MDGSIEGYTGLILPGNTVQHFNKKVTNSDIISLTSAVLDQQVLDLYVIDFQQNLIGEIDEKDSEVHLTATRALAKLFHTIEGYTCALTQVNLCGNNLNGECVSILCSALINNKTIKVLNLRRNPLEDDGAMYVAEMLESNTCLEQVDIGDTEFGHGSLIAMATALTKNRTLKSINLDNPVVKTLEEEALQHIAKMLQNNKSLQHISLCKHNMTDVGAQVLAERLLENRTLTSLHLRANKIGGFGSEAIAALLLSGSNIIELDLSANRMCNEGAEAFETVLSTSDRLKTLCVGHNSIQDEGLARLAYGILHNKRSALTKLLVWGNDFGEIAPTAFDALANAKHKILHLDIKPYTVDEKIMIAKKIVDED